MAISDNKVCLVGRSVPAGIYTDDGNRSVKLSYALVPRSCTGEDAVAFSDLAGAALTRINPDALKLVVRPALVNTETGAMELPSCPEACAGEVPLSMSVWKLPDNLNVDQINGLWRHVMPRHSNEGWDDLYLQLQAYDAQAYSAPSEEDRIETVVCSVSGQIGQCCQIERAIVEAHAISGMPGWQKMVVTEAIAAANSFLEAHSVYVDEVLVPFSEDPANPGTLPGVPMPGQQEDDATDCQDSDDTASDQPTSVAVRLLRAKRRAAHAITDERTRAITESERNAAAAMCTGAPLSCYVDHLLAGTSEGSDVAGLMSGCFRDVIERLLYLNQANIRASAMGDIESRALDKSVRDNCALTLDDVIKAENPETDFRLILSRLRELEENSEFGRLFGLVHDFSVELGQDFLRAPEGCPEDDTGCKANYVYIRLCAREPGSETAQLLHDENSFWTLAKLSYDGNGDLVGFSPASRCEFALVHGRAGASSDDANLQQPTVLDGVRMLGTLNSNGMPRHQLSSIDPRDAMQDLDNRLSGVLSHVFEQRRDLGLASDATASDEQICEIAKAYLARQPRDEPWPLASLKSRSLRLLHFHEQSRCSAMIGATEARCDMANGDIALDADELSLGSLYDVAFRLPGQDLERDPLSWHPSSAAEIQYDDPRSPGQGAVADLDDVIAGFFRPNERERYQRASAVIGSAIKSEETADSPGQSQNVAVVDEVIHEYRGDPLGSDADAGEPTGRFHRVQIDRNGMIDISRSYGALSDDSMHRARPAPLFNALGYYMGARDVYVGGGSTPDDRAQSLLNYTQGVAVPRIGGDAQPRPGTRMLRTEKIARPLVALNGHATANAAGFYSRDYEPSTATAITLRSNWDAHRNRYRAIDNMGHEELVVVPGKVDLVLAHRHAVFDSNGPMQSVQGALRPRDGLRTVRMSREIGGWSTLDHQISTFGDQNEVRALRSRQIDQNELVGSKGRIIDANGESQPAPLTNRAPSNAIFIAGGNVATRQEPYYPDPLHSATAFRLRVPGSVDDWIGPACIIDQPQDAYPDARPVAISIRRSSDDRVRMRHLADFPRWVAHQECDNLRIALPAGFAAELVTWAVPDLHVFALSSEIVTMMAMIAHEGAPGRCRITGQAVDGDGRSTLEQRLVDACGTQIAEGHAHCGMAGVAAPSTTQLIAAADCLRAALCKRPIDVIGGHQIVQMVHAIDRPVQGPMPSPWWDEAAGETPHDHLPVEIADEAHPLVFARRVEPEAVSVDRSAHGLVSSADWGDTDFFGQGPAGLSTLGVGTDVDLGGFLEIHPGSTHAVEIIANVAHPWTAEIDQLTRRRSPVSVRDNVYPDRPGGGGDKVGARELYGFDVRLDDIVEPLETEVLLARFTDIPAVVSNASAQEARRRADLVAGWKPERAFLSMHTLFELASNAEEVVDDTGEPVLQEGQTGDENSADARSEVANATSADGIRAHVEPVLRFTQARRMKLSFRAIGRFAAELTRRARDENGPRPPEPDTLQHGQVEEELVPVPSSKRPDPPIRSEKVKIVPMPNEFTSGTGGMQQNFERRMSLRLSFSRPFLSSGTDEKIGIALSPRPSTFGPSGTYKREFDGLDSDGSFRHRLHDAYPDPRDLPPQISDRLIQFSDRGDHQPLDPHPQSKETEPFGFYPVPLPLFADVCFGAYGRFLRTFREDVSYVADAQMPVHPDVGSVTQADGPVPPQAYFPIDLLLYEPRFDIAREHWYCDICINPRYTLNPHFQLPIVRYQPLAPRDLRVSQLGEPHLCKVLPMRKSSVTCQQIGETWRITVNVAGPGYGRHDPEPDDPSILQPGQDLGPATRMTATLSGVSRHPGGPPSRRRWDTSTLELENQLAGINASWRTEFEIPHTAAMSERFTLVVEEEEIRAAANQPNEPIGHADSLRNVVLQGPVPVFTTVLDLLND